MCDSLWRFVLGWLKILATSPSVRKLSILQIVENFHPRTPSNPTDDIHSWVSPYKSSRKHVMWQLRRKKIIRRSIFSIHDFLRSVVTDVCALVGWRIVCCWLHGVWERRGRSVAELTYLHLEEKHSTMQVIDGKNYFDKGSRKIEKLFSKSVRNKLCLALKVLRVHKTTRNGSHNSPFTELSPEL